MRFIDREIQKLITVLAFAVILLFVLIWAAGNPTTISKGINKAIYLATGQRVYNTSYDYTLKADKTYHLTVKTNKGDIKFLLYKDNAPKSVNNLVNLVQDDFYKNISNIDKTDQFILIGNDPPVKANYVIPEEINADSLGLNKVKVKDYPKLSDIYDQKLLDKNKDKSMKDFYQTIGYKYSTDIQSKQIKKGSLVLYSETPNNFNASFFISSYGELPQYDGRVTNIGEIESGNDILDKINNSKQEDVKIQAIEIQEK